MRVCLEDECLLEDIALPKWFHVCPVCGYYTYDLEKIEKAMNEPTIPIELVDKVDLNRMLSMLVSNQENWDEADWDFVYEMQKKY